jgi:hypothetical protein
MFDFVGFACIEDEMFARQAVADAQWLGEIAYNALKDVTGWADAPNAFKVYFGEQYMDSAFEIIRSRIRELASILSTTEEITVLASGIALSDDSCEDYGETHGNYIFLGPLVYGCVCLDAVLLEGAETDITKIHYTHVQTPAAFTLAHEIFHLSLMSHEAFRLGGVFPGADFRNGTRRVITDIEQWTNNSTDVEHVTHRHHTQLLAEMNPYVAMQNTANYEWFLLAML